MRRVARLGNDELFLCDRRDGLPEEGEVGTVSGKGKLGEAPERGFIELLGGGEVGSGGR